jgi:hypothetical protein
MVTKTIHYQNIEGSSSKYHDHQNAHEGDSKFHLLYVVEPHPVGRMFSLN